MDIKVNIKNVLKVTGVFLIVMLAIGLVGKKSDDRIVKNILISIEDQYDNFFIDAQDIKNIISNNGNRVIEGLAYDNVDLRALEKTLESHSFIKNGEIYKDLKGNLVVKINQRRPLARIVTSNGDGFYIDTDGIILPVSEKYTSRVVLITGEFNYKEEDNLWNNEYGSKLMAMLQFINNDDLWRVQVAQLDIDDEGDINIYPQITKQIVEFGQPENLEKKFNNLKTFYKNILPRKGWNHYSRVNLKYDNQIVAE